MRKVNGMILPLNKLNSVQGFVGYLLLEWQNGGH